MLPVRFQLAKLFYISGIFIKFGLFLSFNSQIFKVFLFLVNIVFDIVPIICGNIRPFSAFSGKTISLAVGFNACNLILNISFLLNKIFFLLRNGLGVKFCLIFKFLFFKRVVRINIKSRCIFQKVISILIA